MAFNNDGAKILYKMFEDYNILFDEKAGSYGTVRLAQWYKEGQEPNRDKAKYEIRKFNISKDSSEEIPGKGISISSKEAMNDLTNGLVDKGFGDTRNILKSISTRDDFKSTVQNIDTDPDDNSDGELFDMRSLLMNINTEEEE